MRSMANKYETANTDYGHARHSHTHTSNTKQKARPNKLERENKRKEKCEAHKRVQKIYRKIMHKHYYLWVVSRASRDHVFECRIHFSFQRLFGFAMFDLCVPNDIGQ